VWYDPKYRNLYCKKNLQDSSLPRCPLLENVFNSTATSFDDILFPPNWTKPPQPKTHDEFKLVAIRQLTNALNWWVKEDVTDSKLLCFYAYSYGPCIRRVIILEDTIADLITEFNYSHPAVAAELKGGWDNLRKEAREWDASARIQQTSQYWIDPSYLNPIAVKKAAMILLYKLRQIGSIVKEQQKAISVKARDITEPQGTEEQGNDKHTEYVTKGQEVWELGYNGNSAKVRGKLRGLRLIEYLLSNPHKEFYPLELLKETGLRPDHEEECADKALDKAGILCIEKNIAQKESEYKQSSDPGKRAELKEEIDNLRSRLKKDKNKHGKPRKLQDTNRKSVHDLIQRVLVKIKKQNEELYSHLDNFISAKSIVSYKPDREIDWYIS